MYKLARIITIPLLLFLSLVSLLVVDVVIENFIVDSQINDFVNNGVYVGNLRDYYFYEVNINEKLDSPSISFTETGYPESTNYGDIFIYKESKIEYIPYSAAFISYFFGGHAGIVVDDSVTIEANGAMGNPYLDVVDTCPNNIFTDSDKRDVVGLRVRATEEDVNQAMEYIENSLDMPYNFSFVFNRKNSFYCTDIISRAFGHESNLDYELDKDGIATSCNDLIVSEDTYMIYYMYYNGNEKHLYYAI